MTVAPIAPIKALSHTAIRVSDLDRSVEFYRTVFGYDVFIDRRAEGGPVLGLIGGHTVELLKLAVEPGTKAPRDVLGHTCAAFSVEDIDATHAALKAGGYIRSAAPENIGDMRFVLMRDPDGTLLELIQLTGGRTTLAQVAARIREKAAAKAAAK